MAHFKCTNCEGEYDDMDRNRVQYFHVCPEGRVLRDDVFTPYREMDRRDENITDTRGIRRDGKGRERIK